MKIAGLTKRYGERTIFSNFSLEIEEGRILCVLGESGGGKTTLLNVLAGLTEYEGTLQGVPDKIAYVFQEPRLLPRLSVRENLRFAGGRDEVIDDVLKKTEMLDKTERKAARLSGGEKQRVSLARAFASDFELLLLDEPFSSLDTGLKIRMAETFAELWKAYGGKRTAVFVTHDIEDALMLADRIVVLKNGKICFDEKTNRRNFPERYGAASPIGDRLLENLLEGVSHGI